MAATVCDDEVVTEPAHTVDTDVLARIDRLLTAVDADLAGKYPGDQGESQPVHTVYVSAAEAVDSTPRQWGAVAVELFDAHRELLAELGGESAVAATRQRLSIAPIQDLRIDFEDGYGVRPDATEDADARRAGRTLTAAGVERCGIRVKGLTSIELARSVRTLELVLDAAGGPPPGFVFTVPKLRAPEQVTAAVWLCEALERAHGLPEQTLRFELQIESPQAIVAADGTAAVATMLQSSRGRCLGLHYGTYDYSAACGIAPAHQALDHPLADHAKAVMLTAAAQTGVQVVDGSTQVLPVGGAEQVSAAMRRHFGLVTRSFARGYYQGWDMHPGHLVTRWLAAIGFYRSALSSAAPRLQAYLERRSGPVIDEPATAEALARVILRGLAVGAFPIDDVLALAPDADLSTLRKAKDRV